MEIEKESGDMIWLSVGVRSTGGKLSASEQKGNAVDGQLNHRAPVEALRSSRGYRQAEHQKLSDFYLSITGYLVMAMRPSCRAFPFKMP